MKVLIITYYWPPAGGSGVQRWLKFVKYLQDFGVAPVVYTVANPEYPVLDETLVNEVPKNIQILKQLIWDPTDLLFWKGKNKHKTAISSLNKGGFFSFIRGNFFIPDPKIFWVRKSVNYLHKYLQSNKVDVIISTGPPHSTHLIAQKLHQKNTIKWIADFRDPWTDLYYNANFKQTSFAKKRNKKLETLVLKNADCVLTVSHTLKKEFSKTAQQVEVITNGFDDEFVKLPPQKREQQFTISYIGLLPKESNPIVLFKVLKKLCAQDPQFSEDLTLNFIGDIAPEVKQEVAIQGLTEKVTFIGRVSHEKAIAYQQKAQVLLLLIPNVTKAEGILTGKIFEYLMAKRPILAIGPETGDLATLLKDTRAGVVVDYAHEERLTLEIEKQYKAYREGSLQVTPVNIAKFHRRELTKKLASLLKNINQ